MACTLNASYIENADPLILEKLKVCSSLDDSQVAAMETLLLSGKTQYGNITTWTKETLADLGILPLYFTRKHMEQVNIYGEKKVLQGLLSQSEDKRDKPPRL
ncbi:mesothelin-like protein [Gouania willdenowi]|uniref:mesothelin-like protein n=1 Tax=Gouania willdenowi TaxID=441366 RepID=UPI0010567F02|nr:mesothelin-like protein [Gouania willdenowi]